MGKVEASMEGVEKELKVSVVSFQIMVAWCHSAGVRLKDALLLPVPQTMSSPSATIRVT